MRGPLTLRVLFTPLLLRQKKGYFETYVLHVAMRELTTLLVDKSQLALIRETRDLLEQLLETMDVMKDKKLMREIALSRREARAGKTRPFRTLLGELGVEA
jgi:hypothetical protein